MSISQVGTHWITSHDPELGYKENIVSVPLITHNTAPILHNVFAVPSIPVGKEFLSGGSVPRGPMGPFPPDNPQGFYGFVADLPPQRESDPTFFHRTVTLDIDVCTVGEIVHILPSGKRVTLHPGDSIVQRGTEHAFANLSGKPARMFSIMLGATDDAIQVKGTALKELFPKELRPIPPARSDSFTGPSGPGANKHWVTYHDENGEVQIEEVAVIQHKVKALKSVWGIPSVPVGKETLSQGLPPRGPMGVFPPDDPSRFYSIFCDLNPVKESDGVFFHRTFSLDIDVCVYGTITHILPSGKRITLHPGDSLVQRGTNHAWANYTDKPARMFSVLLGSTKDAIQVNGVPLGGYYPKGNEPAPKTAKI